MAKKKTKKPVKKKSEPIKNEDIKIEPDESDGSLEDDKYLIKYVIDCKKEAEKASKAMRDKQRELWVLYQNRENWGKKKSWQSKIFIPKIFTTITRAASLVKRAVLETSKLFTMELLDEETAPLNTKLRELRRLEPQPEEEIDTTQEKLDNLKDRLKDDERRFKKELKRSNFVAAYGEMITSSLLTGMGDLKRLYNGGKKKLSYENVDILNLYISPDYMPYDDENPDYLIEYKEMSLAKLRKMAKGANSGVEDGHVFDMEEIEKIKADHQKSDKQEETRERRGLSQYPRLAKKVGILEFWGNVYSKDGKEVKENQLMMVVNEKHLIRKQDNPFDDGKYPHDLTIPMVYPHRGIGGTSLVEPEVKLQYTLNNIMNMMVDNLNFTINKVRTYQPSLLKRAQDAFSVYPGKMIPVTSGGKVIEEVQTNQLGSDGFKMLDTINKEMQESTAITEFLTGMPGSKAKTLGEVEIKTAESQGTFDIIAKELEINSIRPILKGSYGFLVQFSDFKNEYEFNVGGLSLLLMKNEQIQTISQALMMAMKAPQLTEITDIPELWKRLLSIWNVSDVYREPEEVEPEEAEQPQRPSPEQIQQKAAQDARAAVAQMAPEQIMNS